MNPLTSQISALLAEGRTQEFIARELGISQPRVSQLVSSGSGAKSHLSKGYGQKVNALRRDMAGLNAQVSTDAGLWYYYQFASALHGVFTIEPCDVFPLPDECPLTGLPMSIEPGETTAGHVLVHPELGYAPGNVLVVHIHAVALFKRLSVEDVGKAAVKLLRLRQKA